MTGKLVYLDMGLESNDIIKRQEQIEEMVAQNQIEPAIKRLLDFVRDFDIKKMFKPQSLLISANYYEWRKNDQNNTLTRDTLRVERNGIIMSILSLTNEITVQTV